MKSNKLAGADPELLLGEGRRSPGEHLPNILILFSENPYEIKEILVRKGGGRPPPKSATAFVQNVNYERGKSKYEAIEN